MNIAVIFGGKSCEHNISVITGVQALKNVPRGYKAFPVYIDGDGRFFTGNGLNNMSVYKKENLSMLKKSLKSVHFEPGESYLFDKKGKKIAKIDAALLCLHGLNGEDGTVQGVLALSNIPFSGAGVRSSAVSMDKIVMKKLFESCDLPVVPYEYFDFDEYNDNLFGIVERIKASLTFPLIVKPSNLGSSIGISIAKDFTQLFECISVAFKFDTRIVVENALAGFKELNCAVIGEGVNLTASEIEEPVGYKDFLTFDDKYVKKTKGNGRIFPANIDGELKNKVQTLAKEAFAAVGASGVARIDFLLKDNNLFVNEINTIPGSLSNYLFPFSYAELFEKLINIAITENEKTKRLSYSYSSSYGLETGGVKK